MDYHADPQLLTFNVYLSDGGANIIFPNADVQVTPKAGMALTYINLHKGGYRNHMADHAVQAHPENVVEGPHDNPPVVCLQQNFGF